MNILGLTGSIAMGKSTIAGYFQHLSIAVHDSDAAIHHLYAHDAHIQNYIKQHFSEAFDKKTRTILKGVLAQIIFNDPKKRAQLESWLHPRVRDAQAKFIQKSRKLGQKIVVLDIPLLYETGAESRCDYVIVASAPSHIQRQRALRRSGMSAEKFERILASQMPDTEKRARADFVIQTGLSRRFIFEQVQDVLAKISTA